MWEDDDGIGEVFETNVRAAEITSKRARFLDSAIGPLALVRDGERIVAIDAWCPHLDGPLWEGSAAQGEIACPWHAWRFSLRTGACTWAPRGDAEEAAESSVRVLATRITATGQVAVLLPPS